MELVTAKARGVVTAGALAFGLLVAGGIGAAQAGVAECQALIDVVRIDLNGTVGGTDCAGVFIADSKPRNTMCDNLNWKLDNASEKLNSLHLADAEKQLTDFIDRVIDLSTPKNNGKVKMTDGEFTTVADLLNDADAARNCVSTLLIQ